MQSSEHHISLRDIKDALSEVGLKATHQRLVIYKALLDSKVHPTAEEVFESINPNNPSISLGTVYKTLETLVESKLAQKVPVAENKMRYDALLSHHNHIYCINTGEIIDYTDPELDQLLKAYFAKKKIKNLDIKDFSLHIRADKPDPSQDVFIE